MSLCPKAVVSSILLYSSDTWPHRVAGETMLEVFGNYSIRRTFRVRRRDWVPPLPYNHTSTGCTKKAPLVWSRRTRFRRCSHDVPMSRRTGDLMTTDGVGSDDQDKPGALLRTASLRLCMIAKKWVKVSCERIQGLRACGASARDVVNSMGDVGSTRPG